MEEIIIIYNTSVRFCDRLSQIGIIPGYRKNIYIYGFELLLSSVLGIFILAVLSAFSGKPLAWIPYLIGFVPLRITGGGFHAKTHFACIVSFSIVFLFFLILSDAIYPIPYIHFFVGCISLGIVYSLAPVEAANKHLSSEIRQKNRKRCIAISWFNVMVSLAVLVVEIGYDVHFTMYYSGVLSAGISMVVVFRRNCQ